MSTPALTSESFFYKVRRWLPAGRPLPEDAWKARHRGFVLFLWIQSVALAAFGVVRGYDILHSILEGGVVALAAAAASLRGQSRSFRSIAVTLGLLSSSAILVHLSGGTIEAHFHFFVMVILITLYQSWAPFLLSIGYVILHHGIAGTLDPGSVYNHPAAIRRPFAWAFIHGAFIFGASLAGLIVWKRNEELVHQEQEQRALSQWLDSFSTAVAHDLRSPLGAIAGAARAASLLVDQDAKATRDAVAIIERQAAKAGSLVTGLLDLARAKGDPNLSVVDLPSLVRDVAGDVPEVKLTMKRVPEAVVADPIALRQALANLLHNAARYGVGSDGTADVLVSGIENPDGWQVAVCDRGPGIPPEAERTIFDPLVTSDESGTKGGIGLGLAIVNAVAESHGGRVWYEPRPGGGSTFWMFLPRRSNGDVPEPQPVTQPASAAQ